MRWSFVLGTLVFLVACNKGVDADGDGWLDDEDCDDQSADAYPTAVEVCDGIDNNCDGQTDEGLLSAFYADTDGDGFGDAEAMSEACDAPSGYVETDGDCDDADATSYPDAAEICDGVDNDCDGEVDDGVLVTFYPDADADGFGDADGEGVEACEAPSGYVADATDCDDDAPEIHPDAIEVCDTIDNDCDGAVDDADDSLDGSTGSVFYADNDADGFGDPDAPREACVQPEDHVTDATDCDDRKDDVNPAATETCNGRDDDCDLAIDDDDDDLDTSTGSVFYADSDSDGFGDAAVTISACVQPSDYVSDDTDCDDDAIAVNPAATESCNGYDDDCDGLVDDDDDDVDVSTGSTFYLDDDEDGYGDAASTTEACEVPDGFVADDTDCDDGESEINPGATEICNEIDDDCDEDIDDADSDLDLDTASTWYADSDGDGYGDVDDAVEACEQPSDYVDDDTDCADDDGDTYPGADELCDGVDNDCDDDTDEGVLGTDATCPAGSCLEIYDAGASVGDGDYYLDPDGDGTATLFNCDMTSQGGGWTRIVYWNRVDDGDSLADFESLFTENYNNMGNWGTSGTALRWNDGSSSAKVMDYYIDIDVENTGETLFTVDYYGYSMEDSAVWFYGTTAAGEEELDCRDLRSGASSAYSSTERSYMPSFTCSSGTATGTFSLAYDQEPITMTDEVTRFQITSGHYDNGSGDWSYLYEVGFWVR